MKDKLGGKIVTKFIGLRPKTYSNLIDDGCGEKKKKTNSIKKCIIKRRLKFEEYNKCLQNNKIMLRSQQWFKSEAYNYSTEKVNKIASRLMMIKAYNHLTE